MAKGRTVSALGLTEIDIKALKICSDISESLRDLIPEEDKKNEFWKVYGNVDMSRDAGLGIKGGKLQRDALCTRGRTDKAPFSNRNLRWHPLIVAHETPWYAKEVNEVKIRNRTLIFITDRGEYTPDRVYTLPEVYCVPLTKWKDLVNDLKHWNDEDWTNNSCVIPAAEYSPVNLSVETFGLLGLIVASSFYKVDLMKAYYTVHSKLQDELKSIGFSSVSNYFPKRDKIKEVVNCPLCLAPVNGDPANKKFPKRFKVWQPPWRKSKREEGEAESLQLMHIEPLVEHEIRHTPENTRYGHRLCNVAMSDHSVEETVDFMRAVVKAHEKI